MTGHLLLGSFWWDMLAGPIIGGVSGGLTLLLGLRLLGRRIGWQPAGRETTPVHDPFVHGSSTERRISLRRGGNPVQVFVTGADLTSEPVRSWVVDRSMGGLCLLMENPGEVGTMLNVLACHAPKGTPWTKVEVKTNRQEEDGWELGCQFERTPSWSILLLFG